MAAALGTEPEYVNLFGELGAGGLVVGVLTVLRRLISDKPEIPPELMAAVNVFNHPRPRPVLAPPRSSGSPYAADQASPGETIRVDRGNLVSEAIRDR